MKKILIVVDMQNDFITGPLGTPEARAIVPTVTHKVRLATADPNCVVIFTKDTHDENYLTSQEGKRLPVEHCVEGSAGWHLHRDLVDFLMQDRVYLRRKSTFGYFGWPWFFGQFDKVESIELIGVCTDICVVSNALILKGEYPEVPITVDASCCAGSTPERHKAALDVMRSCQIDVIGDETNA